MLKLSKIPAVVACRDDQDRLPLALTDGTNHSLGGGVKSDHTHFPSLIEAPHTVFLHFVKALEDVVQQVLGDGGYTIIAEMVWIEFKTAVIVCVRVCVCVVCIYKRERDG